MAAVLNLDAEELADIRAYTNQSDDVSALGMAKTEFLRFVRRMQLKKMSGQVQMDENWQALEQAEMKEQNGDSGTGAH